MVNCQFYDMLNLRGQHWVHMGSYTLVSVT